MVLSKATPPPLRRSLSPPSHPPPPTRTHTYPLPQDDDSDSGSDPELSSPPSSKPTAITGFCSSSPSSQPSPVAAAQKKPGRRATTTV